MAGVKSTAVRSMCVALCIFLIMSLALSDQVEDHTQCDPMDPCTFAKCDAGCENKKDPLPFRAKCTTSKECCCTFYKRKHPSLVSGDVGTVATMEDDNGFLH
ncbi:unnamed protein product [Urochloa decumbens]|uniref:Uncharacterized protein n=1 Tax=Urochloa decumbens TaxID=240449 RepID=A0ABC9B0N0_9POAL